MAALTDERRAELAAYCRRDELSPDDELLLTQTYLSAAAYMDAAGVSEPADSGRKATYDLCVNYLVADAMDRRAGRYPAPARKTGASGCCSTS